MAKIICTQAEYDKLHTVLDDNPQFLADISIDYEITNPSYKDIRLSSGAFGLMCSECPCCIDHSCNGECFEYVY